MSVGDVAVSAPCEKGRLIAVSKMSLSAVNTECFVVFKISDCHNEKSQYTCSAVLRVASHGEWRIVHLHRSAVALLTV